MADPKRLSPAERATIQRWQGAASAAPLRQPSRTADAQWWDVPGKLQAAERIAKEEAWRPGHNDHGDGMRHAIASRRLANEAGPVFSTAAGLGHEIDNLWAGGPISESVMDMINNSEGIAASIQRREVDPQNIQNAPISLRAAFGKAGQRYDDTSPNRTSYPSRSYGQGSGPRGYKDAPVYESERRYRPY